MSTTNAHASSSKPAGKGKEHVKGGGKGKGPGKGRKEQPRMKSNMIKRQQGDEELKDLQARIDAFVPTNTLETFSQLPLSKRTLKGLKSSHFLNPTPIQTLSIPASLQTRDVLGSAKTGSGKTLAFLIPLLERLYLLKWGPMDGLGAVVISPTRELAVQTFNTLRDIGKYHSFSAGLVIGGKPLKEERDRLGRMNILIATPGRLLQHLDSTVGFESAGVKVLVLDEADRLLDLGFAPALKAIVGHFSTTSTPGSRPDRQTLLFSATQSKDLAALVKLSLHDPLYINCNKPGEEGVVPANLEQYYAVVNLDKKLDALWGFVKSHLKMKGVVFVTSGKQVRFVYETFRRLHPGLPLLHLHGKQKQTTRLTTFDRFSTSKSSLLICTDVAARGLDFPAVDWVIQLDAPEDVDTYIHRVGRTARYQSEGKALLFLCPSEEKGMVQRWGEKSIEVKKIKIKSSKMGDLKQQMQNFAFREPEIKYLGQRAFISYMKSIYLQKDKTTFDLSQYPAEEFAASMGLPGAPQISFGNQKIKEKKRGGEEAVVPVVEEEVGRDVVASDDDSDVEEDEDEDEDEVSDSAGEGGLEIGSGSEDEDEDDEPKSKTPAVRTKYDRMFERKNQSILAPHYSALISHGDEAEEGDDDVFTLARRDHDIEANENDDLLQETKTPADDTPLITSEDLSKRKLKAATSKKALLKSRPAPEKVIFDEVTGEPRNFYESGADLETLAGGDAERKKFLEEEGKRMREAHRIDKEVAKEKKREKKRKRQERARGSDDEGEGEGDGSEDGLAIIGDGEVGDDDDDFINGLVGMLSDREEEEEDRPKGKKSKSSSKSKKVDDGLEDEEALALRLLQGS